MDRPAARARLERMVGAVEFPPLEDGDLDTLLDDSRRADVNGTLPDDDGWLGTWDLNAAAAEGFRWKAAKVAGATPFSADGASYDRGAATRQLLAMASSHESAANPLLPAGGDDIGDSQILGPSAYASEDPVPYIANL